MRVEALLGMLAAVVTMGTSAVAGAQQTQQATQSAPKADMPDSLAKQVKVDEGTARQIAQSKVPKGAIQSAELEREHGQLQYSYDIKVPGKSGITEVNVDALTGKVLSVHQEGSAAEAKEAAQERKPNY
jgi:uncharacterized membrane protein YkoI